MLTRRHVFFAGSATIGALAVARLAGSGAAKAAVQYEVTHTDDEWRKLLSPEAYTVLRHEGTERPYSSALLKEHRTGTFACAGCDLPLFASETKFESGTGWPSFFKPLDNAVATRKDKTYGMVRTEAHCRRCGGHLGHVFDDGPKPTGLRYCMDGLSLAFHPANPSST